MLFEIVKTISARFSTTNRKYKFFSAAGLHSKVWTQPQTANIIHDPLQVSTIIVQKLSSRSVLLQQICGNHNKFCIRKHIFVAATQQQNQNNLILLQCCSKFFFYVACCKQKKSFLNNFGLLLIFSPAGNAAYRFVSSMKLLLVVLNHIE